MSCGETVFDVLVYADAAAVVRGISLIGDLAPLGVPRNPPATSQGDRRWLIEHAKELAKPWNR